MEVNIIMVKGVWVNHKYYASYAAYHKSVFAKEIAKAKKVAIRKSPPIKHITVKPTTSPPSNYLKNIPSANKTNTTKSSGNIFTRIYSAATSGISSLVQRVTALEQKVARINIGQILNDIKDLGKKIYDITAKVEYYSVHLVQLKTRVFSTLSKLEHTIYGDIKHDISSVDKYIHHIYYELDSTIKRDEHSLLNLFHAIKHYIDKVYETVRKDIINEVKHIEQLMIKDKKYIIEYFKLYLEAMFPFLLLKHFLSDKFLKVFAWWVLHIIEKILFDI